MGSDYKTTPIEFYQIYLLYIIYGILYRNGGGSKKEESLFERKGGALNLYFITFSKVSRPSQDQAWQLAESRREQSQARSV